MTMNSLKNKNVVFTGTLCSMKREEAIELAIKNGARIQNFVTEETDILVLAPRQLDIFGADVRSRKLIKAEELRKKNGRIRIIPKTKRTSSVSGRYFLCIKELSSRYKVITSFLGVSNFSSQFLKFIQA